MTDEKNEKTGTLYLVSTPIGNLKDITFRAVETLKSVSIIAAEDTRHTRKLLTHYMIKNRLLSYHDHNKAGSAPEIVKALQAGKDVALVTDAGTPGISDPGYYLVSMALKNGIKVTACPGPCAAIMALSISGLSTDSFTFFGFVPAKGSKRKNLLKSLANENRSMVFYESSSRVEGLLQDVLTALGDRYVVVTRELTKIFEEAIRGDISDLLSSGRLSKLKGELAVIISKGLEKKISIEDVKDEALTLLRSGESVKTVSKQISEQYGISKKEVYSYCLAVSEEA
ncbi:16S rRNA (cytidine(1402)-2'-O)-methyltransferase [Thermodesulfobacteriota bacterium]